MDIGDWCWVVNLRGRGYLRATYGTKDEAERHIRALGLGESARVFRAKVQGVVAMGGRQVADDVQLD